MSVLGGGFGGASGGSSKGLKLSLIDTLRLSWADPDLRSRLIFVLSMFAVYVVGIHIQVPIPGIDQQHLAEILKNNQFFQLIDVFGGGAIKRISIFALGLNPYITSSIIMQILTTAFPQWKKEMQEGGEYARRKQNQRTRLLTLALCIFQSQGFLTMIGQASGGLTPYQRVVTTLFWTAGAMFVLWLGEQISEKGIGNGVSLMIYAGIVISLPAQASQVWKTMQDGFMNWFQVIGILLIFLGTTWFIVYFTLAQRRIPVQSMRRQIGTKVMGGQTSYLPIPVNMAGVIPIIFAISLVMIPSQIAQFFPSGSQGRMIMEQVSRFLNPGITEWQGLVGIVVYTFLIFFFTYFYTAIQYNVDDLADNLKRQGAFIQGVRPGKQTRDFLDSVISRITIAGALFLTVVALVQYVAPSILGVPPSLSAIRSIGGTSLLIMVSVAIETLRQMEASILMRQYGS